MACFSFWSPAGTLRKFRFYFIFTCLEKTEQPEHKNFWHVRRNNAPGPAPPNLPRPLEIVAIMSQFLVRMLPFAHLLPQQFSRV
jgi:hypothetical protein